MISAIGANGQVYFNGEEVTIARKGFLAASVGFFKGDLHIPVATISSIEIREPKFPVNGYIQFKFAGAKPSLPAHKREQDENCVVFRKSDYPQFENLKKSIDLKISEIQSGAHPAASSSSDPIEKIARLSKLLESGALTQEEFQKKKGELLSQI